MSLPARRTVAAFLIVLGNVVVLPLITASPASATTTAYAATKTWTTDKSSTPSATKTTDELLISVTIPAGQSRYISSKLVVDKSLPNVTEVSAIINCRLSDLTEAARSVSGQNVLSGVTTTILTRGFFTAPASSAYTCWLDAQFVNHSADSPGSIEVVGSGSTYIQDVEGNVPWYSQTWQSTKTRVDTSDQAAASGIIEVPASTMATVMSSGLNVIGDENVTVCYNTTNEEAECLAPPGARQSAALALVGVQLVVQQYADPAGLVACGPQWTNGGLIGYTVSTTVHHYKINTSGTMPPSSINPLCEVAGAGYFEMWLRTTANANDNSFVIENNNETVTAAFI